MHDRPVPSTGDFPPPPEIAKVLPPAPLPLPVQLPYPHRGSGKVREIFEFNDRLLLIATDRISAFDVILGEGIPGKGILLTQISLMGFRLTRDIVPHHLVEPQEPLLEVLGFRHPELRWRSLIVRRLTPLPVECVVRACLAGSAWKDYQQTGAVQGIPLPAGLQQGARLPQPIFTPTTKAAAGHDQPLTPDEAAALLGPARCDEVRRVSLAIFTAGARWGEGGGLLLADTKFEFGTDEQGRLHLIDEVFTPDSSRWWASDTWRTGENPPGFDKQFVRDYLMSCSWNYTAPAPPLPPAVVGGTLLRYRQAYERLARSYALITGCARTGRRPTE